MFDYAARRARLDERLRAEGIDALFLAPSADLEYLTGVPREIPQFGEVSYAHGWVTGAFFSPGREPVFVLPRMFLAFDLREEPEGEVVVVAERLRTGTAIVNELRRVKTDEELAAMSRAVEAVERTMAAVAPLVAPGVAMAELVEAVEHELRRAGSRCPSFTTHVFTGLREEDLDSGRATAWEPLQPDTSVLFDFGGVVDGYCSDFGRTVYVGEPPADYLEAYDVMLAAQEAGRRATVPGTLARDVNAACRAPIEDAGLGEHFRHRMGHGIGLNVHERPFLSVEDETPLEAGMTFTDEPSIIVPGRYGMRIEDIVVCAEGGGEKLGSYPAALVANG